MLSQRFCHLFLIGLMIGLNFSCSNSGQENLSNDDFEPRFVITDSLVIDYLGGLSILDIKPDRSEYLMYDFQRKEMVRVGSNGKILLARNLTGDGKDSFGQYFISAHYQGPEEVIIFTENEIYRYDLEFRLTDSREIPFGIFTNTYGVGHVNALSDGVLFTNIFPDKPSKELFKQEDFLSQFPFLTVYDLEQDKILTSQYFPASSQMIKNPGQYRETAPFSIRDGNTIYLLFAYSPEIYQYSFPELELQDTIHLEPGEAYVQIDPASPKAEAFDRFFKELGASSYVNLYQSNGYLMTAYQGAAPQDKVDALPRNIVGGEEFSALEKEYKIPYYQVIKDKRKVWEGHMDIDFRYQGGRLFARRNLQLPRVDEELDYLVYYFYEIQ
ncbi:hypothetical protein [Cyclobacterium jeungdonense]|uniref:6-bladed beta-propeller n=1 Tax=Cyclobacterium jeungdonense TaxID=708087 RepID=A0ABT8C2E3_9BACT|nr:hypothetical protein [Cyclobacterium jeungdonense]MDN3686660.1 hypothetical protein [Cyclobacterium jeungdonense]